MKFEKKSLFFGLSALSIAIIAPLAGGQTSLVRQVAAAPVSDAPDADIYLVLDESPSMLLPTTRAGIAAMRKVTTSAKMTHGCAFACHTQSPLEENIEIRDQSGGRIFIDGDNKLRHIPDYEECQDRRSDEEWIKCSVDDNVSGQFADSFWAARNYASLYGGSNIELRIDAETQAARNLISAARRKPDDFGSGTRLQVFGLNSEAPEVLAGPMTTMHSMKTSAIPELADKQPVRYSNNCLTKDKCNGISSTNFRAMFDTVVGAMRSHDQQNTEKRPHNILLLVTDGMSDEVIDKAAWRRELHPSHIEQCQNLKNNGTLIAIVYVDYPAESMTGNSWSEQFIEPHLAQVEPTLRQCASTTADGKALFTKVEMDGDISAALISLLKVAVRTPRPEDILPR